MESKLINIRDFDTFVLGNKLFESLTNGDQSICNKAFAKGAPIFFSNGKSVTPREIVDVVTDAIKYLSEDFSRTFRFAQRINIIFLRDSERIKTMAVDEHMNLYMNASFIYNFLKMNKELIGAVIMHEVFHCLFNHIERGKNWLMSKGKPLNPQTNHDNNLAADVEVNQTLVRLNVISEDDLRNKIHGMYLSNKDARSIGSHTKVIPMETILNNDSYMKKLREMCPSPVNPDQPGGGGKIKTTEEWDKGYKDGWNKIARIIKKYGAQGAWDKLVEVGIINGAGEINSDVKVSDIQNINESVSPMQPAETYDQGFAAAVGNLIRKLEKSLNPQGDGGSGPQGGMGGYETGVDENDLEQVDLPGGKSVESEEDGGSGLPENITSSSSDSKSDKDKDGKSGKGGESGEEGEDENENQDGTGSGDSSKNGKKQYGTGGKGKSDSEITDDDLNKLANDLKNKSQNGGTGNKKQSSSKDDLGAIGGTGSFINSKDIDDKELEMSGYSQKDIDDINSIRNKNAEKNTPQAIEKAKKDLRSQLKDSDPISRYMDAIEVESAKYKDIWKKVLEKFMAKKTRRAGLQVPGEDINWKNKRMLALGVIAPNVPYTDQEPQDINIYIDVSGSVDTELLEIICSSLVTMGNQYKYSGINICPWASTNNGIHRVDSFDGRSKDEVTKEILAIVSKGIAQCGGGTNGNAAIASMIDVAVNTLKDPMKDSNKDDVHIVITDGYFDYSNIENRIFEAANDELKSPRFGEKMVKNTIWMIYDADDNLRQGWSNEIKKGEIIFLMSEMLKAKNKNT